jgi:PIN domain nuclease of toxin-antitoxin system
LSVLLDTHALIWWLNSSNRLSETAKTAIEDNFEQRFASSVSVWEIATKARTGKIDIGFIVGGSLVKLILGSGFQPLPLSLEHGDLAGSMPGNHKDPFDRMLAAQSLIEDIPLVTRDPAIKQFGVRTIW